MKKRELIFFTAFATFLSANAQEKQTWSLDDCINYALEKNIQLQQNKISLQESEVDVKTAKAALFPSLSFNTGQNVVNRPYQQNSATVSGTEIISSNNKTTYNGSYSLNAQWTLWRTTPEQHQTAKEKSGNSRTECGRNREYSQRRDYKTFLADSLCRRIGQHQQRDIGSEQSHL